MALVLLPCDLPTWPTLQRHLNAIKRDVHTGSQLKETLLKIYNLCSTSLEPDDESMPDQSVFDALCDQMIGESSDECWMSEQERREFFDVQLPAMADYALQLKSLKPLRGLHYSLQQQSDRVEIDRRLAASLVAHAFFSTFPRRTVKTHPTLQDFNFAGHFFHHLHRRSQRAKLRAILNYFHRLNERPPEGHVTFCRQVMSGREWCTLDDWLQCRRPLCPLVVRHDGRIEQPTNGGGGGGDAGAIGKTAPPNAIQSVHIQQQQQQKGIRVCFASRRLGGTFLEDGTSQESAAFGSHPELLAMLPYVESLEDNEAMSASGLCTYSIIHDLKNKAVLEPLAGNKDASSGSSRIVSPPSSESSPSSSSSLPTTSMCLIDAEDYSDLPVRQYEEDNVLRELNKAYLAFRQHYPEPARHQQNQQTPVAQNKQRLPPVGASRDSSSSGSDSCDPAASPWKSGAHDHMKADERNDWNRSTTLVASSGDPSSPRPSICPSSASTSQDQGAHHPSDVTDGRGGRDYRSGSGGQPTMLYGGGRNVPLTLTNATVVRQLVTPATPRTSSPPTEVSDVFLRPGALSSVAADSRSKGGSVYASCHSQDGDDRAASSFDDHNSSTDEFRSANTSLDDDESSSRSPAAARPVVHRPQLTHDESIESDASSGNRAGSLGFALEGSANRLEEDSFSGDGLEREKRWLEHFREKRGGARSNSRSGQKDSPLSSRDSSRYSFSTEFSSELDELYDQFSHWLEDPGNGESGNNGRNTAVFRFAHSLLKRALSDSFASVALNMEDLPDKKMKDIKLSSSAGSSGGPGSDGDEILQQRRKSTQRSWSLSERVGDERLALQLAKEMVEREAPEEQVLPMPDIVPLVPVGAGEEDPEAADHHHEPVNECNESTETGDKMKPKQKKLACQLVSILLEQTLAEIELDFRSDCNQRSVPVQKAPSLAADSSPGDKINERYSAPLRSQESLAWERHQKCTFNVRLGATGPATTTATTTAVAGDAPLGAIRSGNDLLRLVRQVSYRSRHSASGVPAPLAAQKREQEAHAPSETIDSGANRSTPVTSSKPDHAPQSSQPHSPHAERVVLLDRMSPIESVDLLENHRESGKDSEDDKTAENCDRSGEDSDSRAGTVTPMNPTPPRTRRGSWFFKKSREQRHHPSIKHQRARSNSVPTVMELAQLQLFQQRMAGQSLIPDIIVSGENTEDDECFTSPLPTPPPVNSTAPPLLTPNNRRHRSYDDKLQSLDQSSESLLSDEVVEGFSWTLAETIIEDIMKEIGTKQAPNHAMPHPVTGFPHISSANESAYKKSGLHSPGRGLTNKKPGKSILKISSSDSLNRSHSGSLAEQPIDENSDGAKTPTTQRPRLPPVLKTLAQQIADQHQSQSNSISWSQRSTSMPSLCAVDEPDSSGNLFAQLTETIAADTIDDHTIDCGQINGKVAPKESETLLPLITGNWGCGSSCGGDAQLKSMLQWMAASRAGAPCVIYHTVGASSVVKLDIVCRVIMDRHWTVSDLASAVLRYCRCRLDPCRLISRLNEAEQDHQSAAAVWSSRMAAIHPAHGVHHPRHNSLSMSEDGPTVVPILNADRHLFDELLGQYPLKQTEL